MALAATAGSLWTPGASGAADATLRAHYPLDVAIRATSDRDLTPDDVAGGPPLAGAAGRVVITPDGRIAGALAGRPSNDVPLRAEPTSERLMTDRVTVAAWVRGDGGAPVDQVIAGQGWDAGSCGRYAYALVRGGADASAVRFAIRLSDGTTVDSPLSDASGRLWDGTWHAVVGTFDGHAVRLYVDGAPVGSGTAVPGAPRPLGYGERNGAFGVDGFMGAAGCAPSADFTGAIDDVRVYDEALSAAQVRELAIGPEAPPAPPNPPTGPPTGPASPPAPPIARLNAPPRAVAGRAVVLDAGASTGVARFRWDLDGDDHVDIDAAPDAPAVRLLLPRAKTRTVRLTVVGTDGATSTVSQALTVGQGALTGRTARGVPAVATVGPRAAVEAATTVCLPQTVTFQLVEAFGCLRRFERIEDAPSSERNVMRRHYEPESYSSPAVVAAICRQVELGKLAPSRCDDAKQRFARSNEFYVADGAVRLNGVRIAPAAGSAVVVFPMLERVVASNATVTWGSMSVHRGPTDFDLSNQRSALRLGKRAAEFPSGSAPLMDFDGARDLPSIGGFRLDGRVRLSLEARDGRRSSAGSVNLQLPAAFSAFGGRPPSAGTTLHASNAGGPVLEQLELSVPEAYVGPVRFADMRFSYSRTGGIDGDRNPGTSCSRAQWKARGTVFLSGNTEGSTGFRLTAPPSQNGVGFCGGAFQHAGGALTFGGPIPKPVLFPGVFLDEINFAMQLDPVLIRGGGQISVADVSTVRGALLMAFPTPARPYVLTAADAGAEFRPLAGKRFTSPTVAVGGAVGMRVPVLGTIEFGNGALMYSYPDYVYFGGGVRVVVPGMTVTGSLTGEAAVRQRLFQVAGSVRACLGGVAVGCVGADAHLGSKGMSACLDVAGLHPGAGYAWGAAWPKVWLFDGCKPSQFWTVINRSRAAGGRAVPSLPARITVEQGEAVKHLELTGAGGAPDVLVRSPDGRVLSVTGEGFRHEHGMAGIRIPEGKATFVGLRAGPGTYTVEPLAGSAPVTGLAASRKGYDSSYTGSVQGKGARRTLRYDLGRQTDQVVTLVERGPNVMRQIGTARRGRGSLRFTPAPGAPGMREIVAIATLDGVPIPAQRLARYRAPGVRSAARVRAVTVRRRGTSLDVRWSRTAGATAYGVVVRQADGRQRRFRLGPRARRLRVADVSRGYGGTVAVTVRGPLRDWSRARQGRFRAIGRPPTVLQTARHNRRRAAANETRRRAAARSSVPSVG